MVIFQFANCWHHQRVPFNVRPQRSPTKTPSIRGARIRLSRVPQLVRALRPPHHRGTTMAVLPEKTRAEPVAAPTVATVQRGWRWFVHVCPCLSWLVLSIFEWKVSICEWKVSIFKWKVSICEWKDAISKVCFASANGNDWICIRSREWHSIHHLQKKYPRRIVNQLGHLWVPQLTKGGMINCGHLGRFGARCHLGLLESLWLVSDSWVTREA